MSRFFSTSIIRVAAIAVFALLSLAGTTVRQAYGECGCKAATCEGGCESRAGDGPVPSSLDGELPFSETSGVGLGSELALVDPGYIDSAVPRTQIRFRFDAAYRFDEPDRAEFFYSTWTDFGGKTSPARTGPNDSVDSQSFRLYYEHLITPAMSAFVEGALVINNPSGVPGPGPDEKGIGDMIAGIKWVLLEREDRILSFQLKNYIPTGDEDRWLTAGHYSIEPGILYQQQLTCRMSLAAEIRDWIPIGGAVNPNNGRTYAGNVLRYGVGLTYDWINDGCRRVTPIVEFVGWSVLEGQKFAFPGGPVNAGNDNIVNAKIGVRADLGGCHDMYIGYGRAISNEAWYKDILRFEIRRKF